MNENNRSNNRSEEEDNMIANNFFNAIRNNRSTRKRKVDQMNNSQQDDEVEHLRSKKKKTDNYYSNSDSDDWENIRLPMDVNTSRLNRTNSNGDFMHHVNDPFISNSKVDGRKDFCFACSNIGHNMPVIQGLPIQNLLISMGTGLRTTEFNRHCENIYDQYEETIRKPTNDGIIQNKMDTRLLLPEWSVSMIREHLETHHNDPELTIELMMHRIKVTWDFVWKNGLIQSKINKTNNNKRTKQTNTLKQHHQQQQNSDDESDHDSSDIVNNNNTTNNNNNNNDTIDGITPNDPLHDTQSITTARINPKQWKVVKEMIDTYVKLGKSKPENMTPFYKADRYIVHERTKHTFLDIDNKNIYHPKNNDQRSTSSTKSLTSLGYTDNGSTINVSY